MFIFRTLFWGTLLVILVLLVGPWLTLNFDASFPTIELGGARYAGAVIGAAGVLLALVAGIYLIMPGLSRSAPFEAGGSFTASGPYKYVRNPFMLAVILMLWGEAIYLNRLSLLLYAALCTGLLHAWVALFEEPALRNKLGSSYLDYHKSIPRWFPRLKGYKDRG